MEKSISLFFPFREALGFVFFLKVFAAFFRTHHSILWVFEQHQCSELNGCWNFRFWVGFFDCLYISLIFNAEK